MKDVETNVVLTVLVSVFDAIVKEFAEDVEVNVSGCLTSGGGENC